MKRFLVFITVLAALSAAACSGGGSAPPPPPPMGQFSKASLNGQYAFSMSGTELATSGGVASNFFTRIGTFSANGAGAITAGVEDINLATGSSRFVFTGGTYSVNADGRGTLNLTNSTGTLQFSITLTSTGGGLMIALPTDGSNTASGSFVKQSAAAFSQAGIANDYAFDLSGLDPSAAPESILGHLHADGAGSFTSGIADDNDGGFTTPPTSPVAITGTYAADSLNVSDLANFGRGVASIGGITGVFYIVDQTRFFFMETGSGGAVIGRAVLQSGVPTSTAGISGGFVFLMGGTAQFDPLIRGGRFSTSGGALSTILVDQNDAGRTDSFNAASGTYTIDSNPTGRGTAIFTISGAGTFTFVFYLTSPAQGFVQDQSKDIVADGTLLAQPSSVSKPAASSNFAFNWSGLTSSSGFTDEEDIVGQLSFGSTGFTGSGDLNEFGALKQFLDFGVDGDLTLNGDGTGHNTFTMNLKTNPANNNITFFAYIGNNNTIFLLSTQSVRVVAGVLNPQP